MGLTSCTTFTLSSDSLRSAAAALPAAQKKKPVKPPRGRRLLQQAPAVTPARKVLVTITRVGEDFALAPKKCKNLRVPVPASNSRSSVLTCKNCPAIKCLIALGFKCGSGVLLKARTYNSPMDPAVFVDTPLPFSCGATVRAAPCKNFA